MLLIRGVVRPTSEAMDRNVVNLAALAVHQQGLTVAADKIDGVITRVEDRRHFDNAAHEWWGDKFQAETSMEAHNVSPCTTGGSATTSLSQPAPTKGRAGDR